MQSSTVVDNGHNHIDIIANKKQILEPEFTNQFVDILSDDCLLEIFSYLSYDDLIQVDKVCVRWKELSQEIWKKVKGLECLGVSGVEKHYECQRWFLLGRSHQRLHLVTNLRDLKIILERCGEFIKICHLSCGSLPFICGHVLFKELLETIWKSCKNLEMAEMKSNVCLCASEIVSMTKDWKNIDVMIVHEQSREYILACRTFLYQLSQPIPPNFNYLAGIEELASIHCQKKFSRPDYP